MKKIFISLVFLLSLLSTEFAREAFADACGAALTGTFPAGQATKLCSSFPYSAGGSPTFSSLVTFEQGFISENDGEIEQDLIVGGSCDISENIALDGNLIFGATSGKIIPGATSLLIRNNADDATNVTIADNGAVTLNSGGLSVSGDTVLASGLQVGTNIYLDSATAKVIPGATSFTFRNHADNADNLGITDAGVVTARAGLTATTGNITSTAGDIIASTSGKTLRLQEATAGAKCMGTLTANGATPVVTSTTCAETASRIFLSRTSAETGVVQAWISAISNGVSFSITGEAGDTGTYNWIIFNEAP